MALLLYGDSLTAQVQLVNGHVETVYGATTEEFLRREDQGLGLSLLLNEASYTTVALCIGHNDLRPQIAELQPLFDIIKVQGVETLYLVPRNSKDRTVHAYCEQFDLAYLPIL